MARSAEKKMTALARWRAVYEDKISFKERPKLASECNNLKDALGFRRSIISEITKKIAQIQNPSLGEFKLRDLNDEINRLIRERRHWENRITELGGNESNKSLVFALEKEGKSLSGHEGYRYFGAVRELPGVRELFHNEIIPPIKKARVDLSLYYYGTLDEADGVLLKLENDSESRATYYENWKAARKKAMSQDEKVLDISEETMDNECELDNDEDKPVIIKDSFSEAVNNDDENVDFEQSNEISFSSIVSDFEARVKRYSHVEVPSQKDVEKAVVGMKKDKLLQEYMSENLLQDLVDSGTLLGVDVDHITIQKNDDITESEINDSNETMQNT